MKILIIQTRPGIGDLCVFLPALHEIATHGSNIEADLLTKERTCAKETLNHDPHIKNIFYLENYKNSNVALLKLIKKNLYEKVFIFHYGIRYPIICRLAGINNIFFYGWFKKNENIVEKSRQACRKWLHNNKLKFPYKIYRPAVLENNKNNIILGIGGSGPTKKWAVENFIELINRINKIKKYNFLLAGGKLERHVASEIIQKIPDTAINSLCDANISEAISLIEGSKVYIGNDTGFMHLSAGLGVPSFGLFGDTPINYSDYTNRIYPIIPSSMTSVGHGSMAMNKISVEHVMSKIKEII